MKLLTALILLPSLAPSQGQDIPVWFVSFEKGETPHMRQQDMEKMHADHFANLKKLFSEDKLFFAGPLGDPKGVRLGIAAVAAPDLQTANSFFLNDPIVKSGYMKLSVRPWSTPVNGISPQMPDANALEEHRLVWLEAKGRVPTYLAKSRPRLTPVSGTLGGEMELVDVLLFKGSDEAAIRAKLQKDPLVHLGFFTVEIVPLFLTRGSLKGS